MRLLRPEPLPYDVADWRTRPFPERVRMVCGAWIDHGYGAPAAIYALYAVKIGLYIAGWLGFCWLGGLPPSEIASWWASSDAFFKAVLWTMLFEGLGLGCGSGPLTGRYLPPIGGFLHFLRPGTTKLPLLPIGFRRTWLDVALYAAVLVLLVRALVATTITPTLVLPVVALIPLLGLLDKTLFLVFRSEHYLSVLVLYLLAPSAWVQGAMAVWLAIWLWAAVSKLTPHFPAVIGVMTSNAPLAPRWLKRRMVRPDDQRPSNAAWWLAHTGTVLEFAIPLTLAFTHGGPVGAAALVVMVVFHLFILQQVPMGVPLEWNVIMIYGGLVLFGAHADHSAFQQGSLAAVVWLLGFHVALPLYGSLFPHRVSFLLSMRYYAGNWASSVWLFRGPSSDKLDRLVKASRHAKHQLAGFYDADTIEGMLSKVIAFRLMHLHGRAHEALVGMATDGDIGAYEWIDGELVAGLALGWNFGDGHLHGPALLAAIQDQCGFEPGELRVVMLESQPMFGATQAWVVHDAATGVVARGSWDVAKASVAVICPAPRLVIASSADRQVDE